MRGPTIHDLENRRGSDITVGPNPIASALKAVGTAPDLGIWSGAALVSGDRHCPGFTVVPRSIGHGLGTATF